jgi:hypothetical protein
MTALESFFVSSSRVASDGSEFRLNPTLGGGRELPVKFID